jgi:hypothetical protein
VCAVAGNDDRNGKADIAGKNVYAVHRRALVLGWICGGRVGGRAVFPARFRREDELGLCPALSRSTRPTPVPALGHPDGKDPHHRLSRPPYGVLDQAGRRTAPRHWEPTAPRVPPGQSERRALPMRTRTQMGQTF